MFIIHYCGLLMNIFSWMLLSDLPRGSSAAAGPSSAASPCCRSRAQRFDWDTGRRGWRERRRLRHTPPDHRCAPASRSSPSHRAPYTRTAPDNLTQTHTPSPTETYNKNSTLSDILRDLLTFTYNHEGLKGLWDHLSLITMNDFNFGRSFS